MRHLKQRFALAHLVAAVSERPTTERERERVWTDPRIGMPHDQDRLLWALALAFDDNGDPYQPNQEEDERACIQAIDMCTMI
jgi:hypothetical protein